MNAPSSRPLVRPNRHSLGLCAVLAAMWYAGAGQTNGAAYLLCFTLAALAAVSIPHAWANLRGLTFRVGPIPPVFSGESISVPLFAEAAPGRRHLAVAAQLAGAPKPAPLGEISPPSARQTSLCAPTHGRGRFERIEGRATSLYPLGFCTAVQKFTLRQTYFVYPRPEGNLPLPAPIQPSRDSSVGGKAEGEDFAGVREWRRGDSMRHVDWKAAARGHRLLIKQWSGGIGDLLLLDWKTLSGKDTEARLSQLARWTLTAEKSGATYGLALPGRAIPPSRGDAHLHACLRALAEFPAGSAATQNP